MLTRIGVERLRTLYAMLAGIPEDRIDLRRWHCGTTACAVGWACSYPPFVKQGLHWDWAEPAYGEHISWAAVQRFFQVEPDIVTRLFSRSTRHSSIFLNISDKQFVLARVREYLYENGLISWSRSKQLHDEERSL